MTLATGGTDWEHERRGVPVGEVDGIPDDATTWACLERTDDDDVPTTITVYSASDDTGYVTVAVDDILEDVEEFDDVDAAVAEAEDLMDEYGASE
jgi:hypothetical protein